ncbi:MAG: hypothetical protein ACPGR8_03175 [Limisphaerales bacterium]
MDAVEAAPNFCLARFTRFLTGVSFSGAVTFLAAAFFTGALLATAFLAGTFLAGAFLATALLAVAFLAGAFFTAFLAGFVAFFFAATS